MNRSKILRVSLLLLLATSLAFAGNIVFTRPLPVGSAPPNPADSVKWAPGIPAEYFIGDDFKLAQTTRLDSLSVWMVADLKTTTTPSTEMGAGISLWGGADYYDTNPSAPPPAVLSLLASTYTVATEPQRYYMPLDTANPDRAIFKLTFGIDWLVTGGQLYDFAVLGASNSGRVISLHGTTGDPQSTSDQLFLTFSFPGAAPPTLNGVVEGGDINVELTSPVPEPASLSLCGLALLGAGFWRRRRAA